MKNKKGIQDDTVIKTIPDLLARVDEELEKRLAERRKREAENRESLNAAIQKERGIVDEIGKAKKIVEKLSAEYLEIELKTITEKRKEAEGTAIREADVKAGKASLRDFREKGKWDSAIVSETRKKSVAELEQTLKVIREKNLEVLMLEDSLGECRNRIRGLAIQPGRFMLDFLKGLREFTEDEVGAFMGELDSYRTGWDQTKQDILLTQGKSMSGRFTWDNLTMAQARALQFNPALPLSCVEKLKSLLEEFEGSENISIAYYVNLKDIDVTFASPGRGRGLIQSVHLKEDPRAEFKRIKTSKKDKKNE